MSPSQIAEQVQDSLQGNMREIIGTLDLKGLNTDRDGFSDEVMKKASPDMKKLGIEVISCNIQNVTDKDGLIYALGADNTAKIKKDAAITKANADREVAVAVAKASQEANEAQVASKTAIAEQNNTLVLKQAELKRSEDTQKAIADAAYSIQQQEQQLIINTKTVDAQIAQTKRLQVLTEEQVLIKQNALTAEINKEADAKKYQTEVEAAALLEQRKRNAEAEKYEAEQEAEAIKKQADAVRYAAEQEAAGIKAKGVAEAAAIEAKGIAEAEAMNKKAEAYKKYNGAAITEMIVKILPQVAANIAEPMKSIDSVNIYGTDGQGVTTMSGNVPVVIKQVFDTVSEATGVDLKEVMKANTIEAQTNRNISGDINLENGVTRKKK
jgi:flotillin